MSRAFVIVLDSVGIGAAPDAADYGDEGANTLAHAAASVDGISVPVMQSLGLGSIPDLLPGGKLIPGVAPVSLLFQRARRGLRRPPLYWRAGAFTRTLNRRDYSISLPEPCIIDHAAAHGVKTLTVGKLDDISPGTPISEAIHLENNAAAEAATLRLVRELEGPTFAGTDHTHEYVPLLAYGQGVTPGPIGIRDGFYDLAQTVATALALPPISRGVSIL
jgi:phosphopentomutase